MVDVEFLAQMIQLSYGGRFSDLRGKPTVEVIKQAEGRVEGFHTAWELIDAYEFLRKVELFTRIVLEERTTILPEGEKLDLLASAVAGTDGKSFRSSVQDTMKKIRAIFLETTGLLQQH
jgi:glutamate-ammonia-ligase adenylyltransferase